MTPDRLAIVQLTDPPQLRPAAFVFADATGVTWVEPSYRDPQPNTAPAVHRVDGEQRTRGEGVDVLAGDQVVAHIAPLGTLDDPDGSCARALADFTDLLLEAGTDLDAERAVVAAQLQAQG